MKIADERQERDKKMLLADKKDYRRGYKKHYQLYLRLKNANSDTNSRRLLLVYSVECGLKYMLLDKWNERTPEHILNGADDRKKDILKSHNLEKILKELGQQGNFKFPRLETIHKNVASSESYHQICRYCIRLRDRQQEKEKKMEETLNSVAYWIEEGM